MGSLSMNHKNLSLQMKFTIVIMQDRSLETRYKISFMVIEATKLLMINLENYI